MSSESVLSLSVSRTDSDRDRRPGRKDFEALVRQQLSAQHQQIREAFKEMANGIVDQASARDALTALRDPLRRESSLVQLKGLSILGALVNNCGYEFHVELANRRWIDLLVKVARTSRDDRVRAKVLQFLVDWAQRFPALQEFSIALHRLRAKGVVLPPPTERPHPTIAASSQRPWAAGAAASGASRGPSRSMPSASADGPLTAFDILSTTIHADVANLEIGLQRPELLQKGIADVCRRHLQKIQVMLSTDLPDHAMYEYLTLSDQLHEMLGLYDAIFTDSSPEEQQQEKDLTEIQVLERQLEEEKRLKAAQEAELASLLASIPRAQAALKAAQDEAKRKATAAPKSAQDQRLHARFTKVVADCANLRHAARALKRTLMEQKASLTTFMAQFTTDLASALLQFPTLVEKARRGETQAYLQLKRLYTIEVTTRKQLYNKLQELRGNIRVYARVRPLTAKEAAEEPMMQCPAEGELIVRQPSGQPRAFEFDVVYSEAARQEDVFEDTKPLINCVVDGYKVCIFAYGQTGSGKTYTMQGPPDNPGVNRRALGRLFDLITERADVEKSTVTISVLEIYNETIRDLLADRVSLGTRYEIKTHPVDGQYVENLSSFEVADVSEIDRYMARAEKTRASGSTNMNEHSSRSHMVLYVVVRTKNLQSGVTTIGKVSLVDLAGSERVAKSGATGDRMKEALAINKSLLSLGSVISALSKNESFVPYRNSKLTHLLQDSLGGNSKCLMFVNVSPAASNLSESINSLQFAFRARGVALGTAKRNIAPSEEGN